VDPKLVTFNTPISFVIEVTAFGGNKLYQQA
jgi:hypothetical protein